MNTRPTPRSGFTLVEIMVVIAILGSIAAVTVPAFRDAVRSDALNDGTSQLVRLLERARMTARMGGHPVTVTFDPSANRFWVDEPMMTGSLDLPQNATMWGTLPRPRVRFEPAGPVAADAIGVRAGGGASAIAVDPLSGDIRTDAR